MHRIWIIGLGAFAGQLSKEAADALFSGKRVFLQTERCYAAKLLSENGRAFESLDRLYEKAEDFDELNKAIAKTLAESCLKEDIIYAVPGQATGLPSLPNILACAKELGIELKLLPGIAFADAALADAAFKEGFEGLAQRRFANDIGRVDVERPLCVEELDSRILAGEAKLQLLEYYPDDNEIWIAIASDDSYTLKTIELCDLDRLPEEDYANSSCALLPILPFERRKRFGESDLESIIQRLRAPGGCPWDREQNHKSIRADLLEEAYEVAEAIDLEDDDMLVEELGDLLMQVYFHARLAEERAAFQMRDISTGICQKLIYRHPHVFSNLKVKDSAKVLENWETLKRAEKSQESFSDTLLSVPKPLPALSRAAKLQKKAAKAGFDWPDVKGALEKCEEESREFLAELQADNFDAMKDEMGDWLFSLVNVARLAGLDPELCLMAANEKFLSRFLRMESIILRDGKNMEGCDLPCLESYWEKAKLQLQK